MIKCIAIDDEPLALALIEAFCESVPFLALEKTFTQPSAARRYLTNFPVDLVFLDVEMPDINGIELFKGFGQECMVIFTTAFRKYAVDGFEVGAVDYLVKPLELSRFQQACEKAKNYYEYQHSRNESCLYVRVEYALVKIPLSQILYIETVGDYIKIHQLGKKPIMTLMSMRKMMEKLPEDGFIRIHRSYIVPLSRIEAVRAKSVSLGVLDLPIGASYEKAFFRTYTTMYF